MCSGKGAWYPHLSDFQFSRVRLVFAFFPIFDTRYVQKRSAQNVCVFVCFRAGCAISALHIGPDQLDPRPLPHPNLTRSLTLRHARGPQGSRVFGAFPKL